MIKKITLLCTFWLFTLHLFAVTVDNDTVSKGNLPLLKKTIKTKSFKKFESLINNDVLNFKPNISEFNSDYIHSNYALDSVTNGFIDKAKKIFFDLNESQNYIDLISPNDLVTLPVGIKSTIGNITYTLGISKARITPEYMEVTAFVRIIIPQLNANNKQTELFFGANNIKISHKGGIYGDANLVLLGDIPIPIQGGNAMVVLKGGFNMETGDVTQKTFVTINCDGFKEMGLKADVFFPRSMLEPVDSSYKVIPGENNKVKGSFETVIGDWNDLLVEVSLPPFQLTKSNSTDGTGKAGLIFELNTAIFDFSDIRNSENFNYPPEYQQFLVSGNEELWRGVYVNTLKVVLPKQFSKKRTEERVEFQASKLIIDGMGVTGKFSVDNILPLSEGEASKWQFSVDHIEASILTNSLTNAAFDGKIVLPITGEITEQEMQDSTAVSKKSLNYAAIINPLDDEYQLTVTTNDDLSFDIFKAKATLLAESYVELKVSDGKFKPKAVLHGNLAIKGSNNSSDPNKATVDFKGVTFQKLQLQTESPYFMVDYMGYNGEVKFANFPVTISEIGVKANETTASLSFNLAVNLMGENGGFAGETKLEIVGKFNQNEGLHRWKFDRIKLHKVAIKAKIGKVGFDGELDFFEDDVSYGDGFSGKLSLDILDTEGLMEAKGLFGKTNSFRYFYVDFLGVLPSTIPIAPPLGINAFGGGLAYNMERVSHSFTNSAEENISSNNRGLSISGIVYKPNNEFGLDLRAVAFLGLEGSKAFRGQAMFSMQFNKQGGLNRVSFDGYGELMFSASLELTLKFDLDELKKRLGLPQFISSLTPSEFTVGIKKEFAKTSIKADLGIYYDFQNKVLHGESNVYISIIDGMLKGVGAEDRAGWIVFHFSPEEWYVHLGSPQDRIGLKLGLGNFRIETTSYLMIGDNIPGSPPPPAIVAEILGVELGDLDYMRDLNALGTGKGFAFGMDFNIDTGDMTFLVFYARFQAGVGFDIMIKDYGETECHGSGQIGINGWYANGQAYAYLQGELGIKIKLLFIRKKIPIIKAGAAVLLQAKLPNPAWFRGYVGGHFNLLGGLIKGKFRFKVELGDECEIVGGAPLGGLKIISDISPNDGDTNIDVFNVPQVVFNMKINTPFDFEDDYGVKTYRILLDEYAITSDGTPIEGTLEWNENNDILNFISTDVLPPNTSIHIKAAVRFQEKQGGNWVTLTNNGQPALEVEEIDFTTGDAPDYIPLTNIVYTYPVVNQKYYYQNERNNGYVKLKRGQSYLFSPETDWSQKIYFENESGIVSGTNVAYNNANKLVSFGLPTLNNQNEYTLKIISISPDQETAEATDESYNSQETGQEGTTIEVKNKQAQTIVREGIDVEVLVYNFSTSAYNTFAEKINAKQAVHHYLEPIYSDVHAIQTDVQASEKFSLEELNGADYTNYRPLITTEAVLEDTYFTNAINPLIYQNYPLKPEFTVNRDVTELGIPPKKGIDILTWYNSYLENTPSYSLLDTRIPYRYYLAYYYKQDFIDIQYKIVNAYLNDTSTYQSEIQQYNYIINGIFPSIYSGNYKVKMQYVLPGNILGSSTMFNYNNPF